MNIFKLGSMLAGLLVASSITASANSKSINVQGKLTDNTGTPLTST